VKTTFTNALTYSTNINTQKNSLYIFFQKKVEMLFLGVESPIFG